MTLEVFVLVENWRGRGGEVLESFKSGSYVGIFDPFCCVGDGKVVECHPSCDEVVIPCSFIDIKYGEVLRLR